MNHDEEIRAARAAMDAESLETTRMQSWRACEKASEQRSPLDDASYTIQQAIEDFYLIIDEAGDHNAIMRAWERLGELENLMAACASAAGRKADAL